ncbi:MAG: LON peptidase substrate-binding domain-containing protein [Sphingobacteriaceae bacterium]|nr:LON peptidase substrate-binding domain-containing protein [Sphingobacteriaceae bacterium]
MKSSQLTLPMLPLSIVLLPGETTKLYIYEERYKELVKDCLSNLASFAVTYVEKGEVMDYGCEVKIKRVLKTYSNGEMDVLIEGTNLFKLVDYTPVLSPKLYGAATITYLNIDQKIQLNNLQDVVVNYFGSVQNQFIDYDTVAGLTVYNVASSLQLTHPEKYHLISSSNQQLHLLNIIKFINHIINTEHQIKDRFIEN